MFLAIAEHNVTLSFSCLWIKSTVNLPHLKTFAGRAGKNGCDDSALQQKGAKTLCSNFRWEARAHRGPHEMSWSPPLIDFHDKDLVPTKTRSWIPMWKGLLAFSQSCVAIHLFILRSGMGNQVKFWEQMSLVDLMNQCEFILQLKIFRARRCRYLLSNPFSY